MIRKGKIFFPEVGLTGNQTLNPVFQKQNRGKTKVIIGVISSKITTLFFVIFLFNSLVKLQAQSPCNYFCNFDFDSVYHVPSGSWGMINNVPCWQTTESSGSIEIWGNGFLGVPAYNGNQFCEINAYAMTSIYQNIIITPGASLSLSFAHRGRNGVDCISVSAGPVGVSVTTVGTFCANSAWDLNSVVFTADPAWGNNISVFF